MRKIERLFVRSLLIKVNENKIFFSGSFLGLRDPWMGESGLHRLGQAIGPLLDFCAPISIIVEL